MEARGEVVLSAAWGSGGWIWLVGARGEVRLAGEESSNILGGEWKVCGRGDRKCRLILGCSGERRAVWTHMCQ